MALEALPSWPAGSTYRVQSPVHTACASAVLLAVPRTCWTCAGANMGGKSTLLRSTCVAVTMAQLGCYVAASRAVLEPVDAIFTRVGESGEVPTVLPGSGASRQR